MADVSGFAAVLTQAPAVAALVVVLGVVVGVSLRLVLSADRRADTIAKAADERVTEAVDTADKRVTEMRAQLDRLQAAYDGERELRRRGEDRVSELTREVHGLKIQILALNERMAGAA